MIDVCAGPVGSVEVAELDWGNQQQAEALNPPFDYIIGTDVVRFLSAIHHVSFIYSKSTRVSTQIENDGLV